MSDPVPWHEHALRGALLVVAVLVFQRFARGYLTPSVAVAVGIGYVLVAELVRRRS